MTVCLRPLSAGILPWLLAGTALLLGGQQDAVAAEPQEKARQQDPADPGQAKQLGKITVTAQSRSQEVQSVPIAMQIVTSQQVDMLAATDLSRMDLFVPGLVIDASQPTQPTYALRGIATGDFGVGTDSAVGVYVNGVYAARSGGALLAFNDIQRIEVLKGPQGTLFGRNAAAGAISIVTNEPGDRFEGRARVRIGSNGLRYADALVNVPINKDMALRLSVLDNQSDGWLKDAATGRHYAKDDDWGTRAVFRWNLGPDTRMLLAWDHEKLKQPPTPAIGLIRLSSDPQQRAPFPSDPASYLNPLHAPLYNDAVGAAETRRFDGVTLSLDHSFGWGSLTSITAWRGFDTFNRTDNDGTNHIVSYLDETNLEHNNSWYQEFKLAGNTELADWVGGVSYYQEQARQTGQANIYTDSLDTLAQNNLGIGTPLTDISRGLAALGLPYTLLGDPWQEAIRVDGRFKAYAAFGDVIWHLGDRFNLTTGIRYTRDQKNFSWYNIPRRADAFDATVSTLSNLGVLGQLPPAAQAALAAFGGNVIFPEAAGRRVRAADTWNNLSPRVVADYKFTPDVMGYASIAKGYKAGGYNSVQVGSRFAPEKVINYEAGVKSLFPEQRLLFNASLYYYRYDHRQSLTLAPQSDSSSIPQYLVNSTDQQAKGLDLQAQWQPLDALTLNFTGSYIDATYRKAVAPSGVSLSGQPTGEPLFSFTAGVSYVWRQVANGSLEFDLSYARRGTGRTNSDSRLQGQELATHSFTLGAARQRTDARLDWRSSGDRWGVALYVTNLFDDRYVATVDNVSDAVFGTPYASITPPRSWGLELRAKF